MKNEVLQHPLSSQTKRTGGQFRIQNAGEFQHLFWILLFIL